MRRSTRGAVKRLIQSEVSARTGRPMTNKAAKKWLKRQRKVESAEPPTFTWPTVHEFPRAFGGMSRWQRFPSIDTVPFGWKQLPAMGLKERIIMPAWFYGLLWVKEHGTVLFHRALGFALGYRRVKVSE